MVNCLNCGKEFDGKRSTSKHCSPKCKQAFYRNRMKAVSVTDVTVNRDKSVSVTDKKWAKIKATGAVLTDDYEMMRW